MNEMDRATKMLASAKDKLPAFPDSALSAVLSSFGAFFFIDGPYGGIVALSVLCLADWWMAAASLISTSSAVLIASKVLRMDPKRLYAGFACINAVQLGLCMALMQRGSWTLVLPIVALSGICIWLQEIVLWPVFTMFGLSPMGVPALLCTMLWRDGLSDAIGLFPPMGKGPLIHTPITMEHATYGVLAGIANVGFVPPSVSAMSLMCGGWLATSPATFLAMWSGGTIGVLTDVLIGAPSHFWTAMTGLNCCLAFTSVFTILNTPSRESFVHALTATVATGTCCSVAGRQGFRIMTWPMHFIVMSVQVRQSMPKQKEKIK